MTELWLRGQLMHCWLVAPSLSGPVHERLIFEQWFDCVFLLSCVRHRGTEGLFASVSKLRCWIASWAFTVVYLPTLCTAGKHSQRADTLLTGNNQTLERTYRKHSSCKCLTPCFYVLTKVYSACSQTSNRHWKETAHSSCSWNVRVSTCNIRHLLYNPHYL